MIERINENNYDSKLNYRFIMNILKKMYGYNVTKYNLKDFENTMYYSGTKNSYDYMDEFNDYMKKKISGNLKEETNTSSVGSYETPGFLAKNIPNLKQGAKTTYGGPDGKFVKVKSKCRKFPYCNQGAVDNPLELSDKYKGESSLSGEMKLTPTYPKGYKGNVHLPKTKWVNESYILSNNDKEKNNWAVFKIMYGRKYFATRLNDGKIDEFNNIKYSDQNVLKFTYNEALKLIKNNGGFGVKIGLVNDKGIQKVYDMSNKKGYQSSEDDVRHIQTESLSYSGRDVTKLPVIGRVITYPIGPYGEGEENVVEIIKGGYDEDMYVTDKWYKEHKRIPLIIHSKLVKEYIPNNMNEGIKDTVLNAYDKIRDDLYNVYYIGKSLTHFGYKFPSLYKDIKQQKGDKKLIGLVVDKYIDDMQQYIDNLFKKHPEYRLNRQLKELKRELQELEDLTLDNFEKYPERFTKHQRDILLKSYDVTPDGIKRVRGIEGDDIDRIKEEAIPGGKSKGKSIKDIAKFHKVSMGVAVNQWSKGIRVEMEHTNNKKIAAEIAKDHIYEDIYYYDKLAKIEK